MYEGMPKFEISLFDGKSNFMLWQSTVQDLLVQQGLDLALEENKPDEIPDRDWDKIRKRAVSTIKLALALEIKYNVLTETTPTGLWKKLGDIYASKSLTNRLCLKMDLYSLKMDEGTSLHDHLNEFNRLVSHLLAIDSKELKEEEKALLLLSSLPKSYRPLVQTLLVGKTTLMLDDVIAVLRENERFMGKEDSSSAGGVLAVVGPTRGRTNERHGGSRERSKSRFRDYSEVECYYCGEKGHIQTRCKTLWEDMAAFKKAQQKSDDGKKNETCAAVTDSDDDGLFLATCRDESHTYEKSWVLDSAASMHICNDKDRFDDLKEDESFGNIVVGNGNRVKIEGIGSVQLKLHYGGVKTLRNVRYVPSFSYNLISLGELASRGYKYIGNDDCCKVYKNGELVLQGKRNEKQLYLLDDVLVKANDRVVPKNKKTQKRVSFSDVVEQFGDSSQGRIC